MIPLILMLAGFLLLLRDQPRLIDKIASLFHWSDLLKFAAEFIEIIFTQNFTGVKNLHYRVSSCSDNYEPTALLQTTSIERRKIFEGRIGYQIPDLPIELGILPTPHASPEKSS